MTTATRERTPRAKKKKPEGQWKIDGTEPLNRKMERIMAEKFTEKMEDSE